jgi:hypothetical protein
VLASVLAINVWTKDESVSDEVLASQVEVWGGDVDSVELITFESEQRKVRLESKKDQWGRFFVGTVDKESRGSRPAHHPPIDGGVPETNEREKKRETTRFIAVKQAEDLASKLAPLLAVRTVGKIEGNRLEEFGLDKPEGTLKVKVGGKEHALQVGTATGGPERYAKLLSTGVVYAVPGEIGQSMLSAESKLLERAFHAFDDVEVTRVKIGKGGKSREAVRPKDKTSGWADPGNPAKVDETIGNYMTKVGNLRLLSYVEKPEPAPKPEDLVLRVDYFGDGKAVGYLEVYKVAGDGDSERDKFFARSENSRWYAQVIASGAEPLAADLAGVLK